MNAPRWRYALTTTALLVLSLGTTGCQTETHVQSAPTWTSDSTTTTIPPSNPAPGQTLLPGGVPNGIGLQ